MSKASTKLRKFYINLRKVSSSKLYVFKNMELTHPKDLYYNLELTKSTAVSKKRIREQVCTRCYLHHSTHRISSIRNWFSNGIQIKILLAKLLKGFQKSRNRIMYWWTQISSKNMICGSEVSKEAPREFPQLPSFIVKIQANGLIKRPMNFRGVGGR